MKNLIKIVLLVTVVTCATISTLFAAESEYTDCAAAQYRRDIDPKFAAEIKDVDCGVKQQYWLDVEQNGILPGRLKQGDTVALLSSATRAKDSVVESTITRLESLGLKVMEGDYI